MVVVMLQRYVIDPFVHPTVILMILINILIYVKSSSVIIIQCSQMENNKTNYSFECIINKIISPS